MVTGPYALLKLNHEPEGALNVSLPRCCHSCFLTVALATALHALRLFCRIITSQGPGTTIPFALHIVKVLCGDAEAAKVAKGLLVHYP